MDNVPAQDRDSWAKTDLEHEMTSLSRQLESILALSKNVPKDVLLGRGG